MPSRRRGCSVVALDASGAAIEHLRQVAITEGLTIDARQVDLRHHAIQEYFDTVVSIGLLMFFDCTTAFDSLADIQEHIKEGGTAIINVLVEGTTYLDMFDADSHCQFARDELDRRFAHWEPAAIEYRKSPRPAAACSRSPPSSRESPAVQSRQWFVPSRATALVCIWPRRRSLQFQRR